MSWDIEMRGEGVVWDVGWGLSAAFGGRHRGAGPQRGSDPRYQCGGYVDVYGEHVVMIEYREEDVVVGCDAYPEVSVVLRDVYLVSPTRSGYVYDAC